MPNIFASGTEIIPTSGKEYGTATVLCKGLDPSFQIVATSRPSGGGLDPIGWGPLYVAFVKRNDAVEPGGAPDKKPTKPAQDFDILVYDIMAKPHNASITVDWVVVRP